MPRNWWAEKLNNGRPAVPQQQPVYPSPQHPAGPIAGGFPAPPGQQPPQQPPAPPEEAPPPPGAENSALPGWWNWRGNRKGAAAESTNCPSCGSPRYFTQRSGGVLNTQTGLMAYPKPECMECGYPNEQGSSGMSDAQIQQGTAVIAHGPARLARQDEAAPPPGSIGHLRRTVSTRPD